MMEELELDELRKTAEAATPGPWECVEGNEAFGVRSSFGSLTWDDHSGEVFKEEDAEFIATFDPPTVLAILSRLEQAEQIVTIRESELLELKGKCSNPECRLHRAHSGPCDCIALDGDGRG